jgi:NAD(P)-dependent dehydrogenase (short-subunit alcohol dehydrogenase family)
MEDVALYNVQVTGPSVASRIRFQNSAVYSGTKAAVDAITVVLSRELGPKKIRVNTISPGVIETEGTHSGGFIGSDFEKVAVAQTPLGRIGQPGDIASIAVFLASEYSAFGSCFGCGGGGDDVVRARRRFARGHRWPTPCGQLYNLESSRSPLPRV